MSKIVGWIISLPILLALMVFFFGVSIINLQEGSLQQAKFMAMEDGAIAGGITPAIQSKVNDFLKASGFELDQVDWTGTTLILDSGPYVDLNQDIHVVISYPRKTLVDISLSFFGLPNVFPDRLTVQGIVKSQYYVP